MVFIHHVSSLKGLVYDPLFDFYQYLVPTGLFRSVESAMAKSPTGTK